MELLAPISNTIPTSELKLPFDIHHESLPLLSNNKFQLFHLYGYPKKTKNNLYQIIIPDIGYLAMDEAKENYIIISENELQKCYNKGNNSLICALSEPIISLTNSGSCSVCLLTKASLTSDCDLRVMNNITDLNDLRNLEKLRNFGSSHRSYINFQHCV